jgi:hypothetical protein
MPDYAGPFSLQALNVKHQNVNKKKNVFLLGKKNIFKCLTPFRNNEKHGMPTVPVFAVDKTGIMCVSNI